ncbi:hypothetical protein ACVWZK_006408 [Bradyrhizobium sp. GM0.4]
MNPHKGEVELKAGDASYTLRFSIDAVCSMEESLGRGFPAIVTDLADETKMSISTIRHVLHAGLLESHPEMTLKEAGELILTAGGAAVVLGKISDALGKAFPAAEGKTQADPPRGPRRAGTGRPS